MIRFALLSVLAFATLTLSACGDTPATAIEDFASSMGTEVIDVTPISGAVAPPAPKRVEVTETQSVTVTEIFVQGQPQARIPVVPAVPCKVYPGTDRSLFYLDEYGSIVHYIILDGPGAEPKRSDECPNGAIVKWVE